jgi:hypothetical protein
MLIWRGLLNPVSTVANSLFGGTLARHIATVLSIHARYVELLFFPIRLAGDYAPPVIEVPESLLAPPALLGALWLALLIVLAIRFYRRGWLRASFGILWYLITMLPVSHIIPHHELAAEHYLYIPLVGLALCAADLLQRVWRRIEADASGENAAQSTARRRIIIALIGIALILLGARSFLRAFDYQSEIAHSSATIRYFPASVRGRARLGLALLAEEKFQEARPHLQYVLGTEFQGSARQDVLRILGEYFVAHAQYKKSVRLLEEFLSLRPDNRPALTALSKAYFELGAISRAHQINGRLVELEPFSADYRYKLALTSLMLNRHSDASVQVFNALDVEPNHIDALLLAANITASSEPDVALNLLEKAERALEDAPAEKRASRRKLLRRLRDKLGYGRDESPNR